MTTPITGTAAGVPYTALPPTPDLDGRAPLLVTWHMLDAPRTDAAFAAALPMTGVPAWRVHLGMPMTGARMVDGRPDTVIGLARQDALLAFLAPIARQAVEEFPAALQALRDQLPVDDGPISILGASLGGAVALEVMTSGLAPLHAVALVNPAVRIRSVVDLVAPQMTGSAEPYPWTPEAHTVADRMDYVARAAEVPAHPPLLLISGDLDHPDLRKDATDLVDTLSERYTNPADVELATVLDLPHPLADEPGMQPAPQRPATKVVDDLLTQWFRRQL